MRRYAVIALAALALPAPAEAQVLDVYSRLAARDLRPGPLVPTRVPRSLRPMDETISAAPALRAGGYALRIATPDSDAIVVLEGGGFRNMGAALRDARRLGFSPRRMRIRGRRGYLMTRRLGPTNRLLVWREGGRIHSLGSGTPGTVSLAALRDTAAGLEPLERDYMGSAGDPDNPSEGFFVTTPGTVTGSVGWGAQCANGTPRAGQTNVTMLARRGDAFTFEIAGEGWTGTVTGSVAPGAVTVNLRATGTFDGTPCDTGPVQITLDRRS
jgi:hypothetical protein